MKFSNQFSSKGFSTLCLAALPKLIIAETCAPVEVEVLANVRPMSPTWAPMNYSFLYDETSIATNLGFKFTWHRLVVNKGVMNLVIELGSHNPSNKPFIPKGDIVDCLSCALAFWGWFLQPG